MKNAIADTADLIFELLKRRGPLCQSQLSTELLVSTHRIEKALRDLEKDDLVEVRPEHRAYLKAAELPWGIKL